MPSVELYVPTFLQAYELAYKRFWVEGYPKTRLQDAVQTAGEELWKDLPSLAHRYPNNVGVFYTLFWQRAGSRLRDVDRKPSNSREIPTLDEGAGEERGGAPQPDEIVIAQDEARRTMQAAVEAGGQTMTYVAHGYTPTEIAAIEGRTTGAVRTGVHRARRKLAEGRAAA